MSIYLVLVQQKKPNGDTELEEALRESYTTFPLMPGAWLVQEEAFAMDLAEALESYLREGDKLVVQEIDDSFVTSGFGDGVDDWMDEIDE